MYYVGCLVIQVAAAGFDNEPPSNLIKMFTFIVVEISSRLFSVISV